MSFFFFFFAQKSQLSRAQSGIVSYPMALQVTWPRDYVLSVITSFPCAAPSLCRKKTIHTFTVAFKIKLLFPFSFFFFLNQVIEITHNWSPTQKRQTNVGVRNQDPISRWVPVAWKCLVCYSACKNGWEIDNQFLKCCFLEFESPFRTVVPLCLFTLMDRLRNDASFCRQGIPQSFIVRA